MSEWVRQNPPITCETCSQNGPHLRVGDTLFCGNCDDKISEGWQE